MQSVHTKNASLPQRHSTHGEALLAIVFRIYAPLRRPVTSVLPLQQQGTPMWQAQDVIE